MERAIAGYHIDEVGDWVAELGCGHNQHVRHRPPFQLRPWVLEADGRAGHLGSVLPCPLCDRAELPDGLRFVRSSAIWDGHTMPHGLRRAHRITSGTWGRIVVHDGRLRFRASTSPPLEVVIDANTFQAIPPDVEHEVEPLGPVRFAIEFLAVDRRQERTVPHRLAVVEEGGDPACWAHLVAEDSGTIAERRDPVMLEGAEVTGDGAQLSSTDRGEPARCITPGGDGSDH